MDHTSVIAHFRDRLAAGWWPEYRDDTEDMHDGSVMYRCTVQDGRAILIVGAEQPGGEYTPIETRELWLSAREVADILGYATPRQAQNIMRRGTVTAVQVEIPGQPRPVWLADPASVAVYAMSERKPGPKRSA